MATACYLLTAFTMGLCSLFLLRRYRYSPNRLLLWSGLCFAGLAVSNALEFVDIVLVPENDLFPLRLAIGALATGLLLYGLIWDVK